MAKLLKLRRGTTSQHSSFTGAEGEVTVDTTKDTIVVHDGSTAGGTALAKESAVTAIPAVIDEDNMSSNSATRPPSQQSVKAYVDALPDVIDEDNFASNSATRPASQQSVKAYVDALPDVIDEDNMSSNSATRPPSQQSTKAYVDAADATKAPLASPALTGTATAVNLELSGNLVVNGTTTTVATTNTTVTDNLLELNSGASSNANDAGILIERGSTGDNAIIAWDESADRFTLGTTTSTNTATGNISVSTGTLAANIVGNVTGNTSGSSGSCTGNAATATNADTVDNQHASEFYREGETSSATVGPGWVSVADGISVRRHAEIFVSDSDSGDHAFIRIDWMRSYADTSFTVLNCGGNNNRITGVRVLNQTSDNTYGNKILQVYVTTSSTYRVAIKKLQNQYNWTTFAAVTPVVQDTLTGYAVQGNQLENLDTYPLATEQGIQAGGAIRDSKGDVRSIPPNFPNSTYTLIANDAGKFIKANATVTIPNSVFSSGDAVTIVNITGSDQTITQGSSFTLYNTADASSGNRTLAGRGMCTILFESSSVGYISGAGLS